MNMNQAFEAMKNGKAIRRPSWRPKYFMTMGSDGFVLTYNELKEVVAKGWHCFNDKVTDYELYQDES